MKVAILGGSGLLGRHIARGLLGRGDTVVILTRDPAGVRRRAIRGATLLPWSPDDPSRLAASISGLDAVINLAGVPVGPRPWTTARRTAILDSRLRSTRAVVEAMAELEPATRPRVLINASGTDVYTGQDRAVAPESSPASPGFLADVCLAWEAAANRAGESGVRVVILRIGFVLAPDAASLRLYALPFRLHLGGPIGNGRQWMRWIHIEDLVRLVLHALDDARVSGIVNAVSPAPARQADVADAIAAALGRRSWLRVPAWTVRLAMGAQSVLPLGSRRIAPARAVELGFRFDWIDLRAAMADVLASRAGKRPPSS